MRSAKWKVFALTLVVVFSSLQFAEGQAGRRRGRNAVPNEVQPAQPVQVQQAVPEQVVAPQAIQQTAPAAQVNAGASGGVRRLSSFMYRPVYLQGNVAGGKVRDFVLSEDGCLEYIVVAQGDNYALVPYSAVNFNWNQNQILLNMNQQRYSQIPTFTTADWSTIYGPQSAYLNRVNTFFGASATGATGATGTNVRGGAQGSATTNTQSGTRATTGTQTQTDPGRNLKNADNNTRTQTQGTNDRKDTQTQGNQNQRNTTPNNPQRNEKSNANTTPGGTDRNKSGDNQGNNTRPSTTPSSKDNTRPQSTSPPNPQKKNDQP